MGARRLFALAAALLAVGVSSTAFAACPLTDLAGNGERRQLLIGWPDPGDESAQNSDGTETLTIRLFATMEAAPADAAADEFWAGAYRGTHYWSQDRLARFYLDCLRSSGEFHVRRYATIPVVRGELVHRRLGYRVTIESSDAVCAAGRSPPYRKRCVLIEVRPSPARR